MLETTSIDLMNAYVTELVAYNRTLVDDVMLAKAKFAVAQAEVERLTAELDKGKAVEGEGGIAEKD